MWYNTLNPKIGESNTKCVSVKNAEYKHEVASGLNKVADLEGASGGRAIDRRCFSPALF